MGSKTKAGPSNSSTSLTSSISSFGSSTTSSTTAISVTGSYSSSVVIVRTTSGTATGRGMKVAVISYVSEALLKSSLYETSVTMTSNVIFVVVVS